MSSSMRVVFEKKMMRKEHIKKNTKHFEKMLLIIFVFSHLGK